MKAHSGIVILSFTQLLLICGCEAWVFYSVFRFIATAFGQDSSASMSFILTYISLFLISQLFYVFLICDAVNHQNTMQIVAAMFFNLCSFSYSGIQIHQIGNLAGCLEVNYVLRRDWNCPPLLADNVVAAQDILDQMKPFLYVIVSAMALFVFSGFYLGYKVYIEYGWLIFQIQGAGLSKRRMLRRYHLFVVFLKLNIYFSFGILAQILTAFYYNEHVATGSQSSLADLLIPGFAVMAVVSLFYYAVGYLGIRRASKKLMIVFLAIITASAIVAVLALVIVNASDKFKLARVFLSVFSAIQFLINFATFIIALQCMADFDQGFQQVVVSSDQFSVSPNEKDNLAVQMHNAIHSPSLPNELLSHRTIVLD